MLNLCRCRFKVYLYMFIHFKWVNRYYNVAPEGLTLQSPVPHIFGFHFVLAHYVPPFEHGKDKMWHQSAIFEVSNLNNFYSLEIVDRVSETQLQVVENSNWIIWRSKGLIRFFKSWHCSNVAPQVFLCRYRINWM